MSEPLGVGMEEPENRNGAFPRLSEEQRARLRALGMVRKVESGEVLFRDGDAGYDFFVVESGVVAVVQGYRSENRVIAVHGPHRFLGELNLLTGSRAYLTAVVRDPGEVIQVPVAALRALVAEDEELGNVILRAFLSRRSILIEVEAGVKVVGSRYSRDTRRLREFLAAKPRALPMDGPRERRRRGRPPAGARRRARRDAGRDRRRGGAAQPLQRPACGDARPRRARRAPCDVRPGDRRGRSRRPGGSALRRLGGA